IRGAMQNGSHFLLSELVRTKAEILSWAKDHDVREVETLLQIDIAEQQHALVPALRSAISMARIMSHRRRGVEARDMLAPYASLIASLAGTREAAAATELM